MIQFISSNTEPSQDTLSKITLINALNERGVSACLYGSNSWPSTQCNFKLINDFKINRNSLVLIDGLDIESNFDLININFLFYSFGRKKAVLRSIKKLFNYIVKRPLFIFSNHKIKSIDNNTSKVINSILDPVADVIIENKLLIFRDITDASTIEQAIKDFKGDEVWLFSSINSPLYFKQKIIPLLEKKKIMLFGYEAEKYKKIEVNRLIKSTNYKKAVDTIISRI